MKMTEERQGSAQGVSVLGFTVYMSVRDLGERFILQGVCLKKLLF